MNCLITGLAQSMENIHQVLRQQSLAVQRIYSLYCRIIIGRCNTVLSKHQIDNGLASHAELHQAGIGVIVAIALGLNSEII